MKTLKMKASIFTILFLSTLVVSVFGQRSNPSANRQFVGAKIRMDKYGRAPVEIRFKNGKQNSVSSFFEDYRKSFPLSTDNELIAFKVKTDKLGQTHHRFTQKYKGIEIDGIQIILHEKKGFVFYANGRLIHGLKLEVTPTISENEALQIALNYINADAYMWENESQEAFLKRLEKDENATFYPKGELRLSSGKKEAIRENFSLVYRFDIYAEKPLGRHYVYIDAKTGEVVNSIDRIHHSDVAGTGLTLYNGSQNITIDSFAGGYRLREAGRGGGIETWDMQNGTNYGAAVDFDDTDTDFTDANDQAGVSAHWATEYTYDYYLNEHSRNSVDDAGLTLLSYVHYDVAYNNAYWNGSFMTYGDGDGSTFTPLVCIDVVAHEITHGVTDYSADLIYSYESGALNESFSDVFGTTVEFYIEGAGGDWLIGEDIYVPGGGTSGMRSMENPNANGDPDTYFGNYWYSGSGDNGGVHTNSGVQNFWFYLLTVGGSGTNDNGDPYSVTGIGMDNAAAIAYRNLTVYLGPSSNYYAARDGAINAAIDLFGDGSTQHQAVMDAWDAVGVYESLPAEGILVWEGVLSGQDYSGAFIDAYLTGAGFTNVTYTNMFPPSLIGYDAVFLSFGNFSNNYTAFNDGMASAVEAYLNEGGKVYLEGGDALGFNQSWNTVLHGLFGLSAASDGSTNIIDGLEGQPGALTEGMLFTSSTQVGNGFIDQYSPGSGTLAFVESSYGNVGVQYAPLLGQRTFCFSYALAELTDGTSPSTRSDLMAGILDLFDLGGTSPDPPIISVTPDEFDESLPLGGNVTRTMNISNVASTGASDLNFMIVDIETSSPLTAANIQIKKPNQRKGVSDANNYSKIDFNKMANQSDHVWPQFKGAATANFSDIIKRGMVHDAADLGDILESFPAPASFPMGVAYDPDFDAVWVTNEETPANIYLLEILPPHSILTTINLDGIGLANSVNGIAVVGDLLYLTDYNGDLSAFDDHIFTVNKNSGALGDVWHTDGVLNPNTSDTIGQILGIAWTGVGMTFYVVNNIDAVIREIELTPGGGNWVTLSTTPSPSGAPLAGIDHDPTSSFWVSDAMNATTTFKLDDDLNVLESFGNPGTASLGISSLQNGTLWMSDFGVDLLYVIDAPQDALWLTEAPSIGSVEPGSTLPIDVIFNATGLVEGDYYADIRISCNDPLNPIVTIPVHLNVYTGFPPDIDVSPTSFTFDVPVGGTDNDVLTISNVAAPGSDALNWSITEGGLTLQLSSGKELPVKVQTRPTESSSGKRLVESSAAVALLEDAPEYGAAVSVGPECSTGEIHDDGTVENGYGWTTLVTDGRNVELFNPGPFPFNYTQVCISWTRIGADSDIDFNIQVYDDDGLGGAPGTLLASIPATATGVPVWPNVAFYDFDVTGLVPPINNPTVYIGAQLNPTAEQDFFICADESPTTSLQVGYGGNDLDGFWIPLQNFFPDYRAMFIRAEGSGVSPGCDWLTEAPTSGSIPAGSSRDVDITVVATGMGIGSYDCNIIIVSNDPDENPVTVPVTLNVHPIASDAVIWQPSVEITTPQGVIDRAAETRGQELTQEEARRMLDEQLLSQEAIEAALNDLGITNQTVSDIIPLDLSTVKYLFVILGQSPINHVILSGSAEASKIENYIISAGGKVYMEGGDVWYRDPIMLSAHDFGAIFGINGIDDGAAGGEFNTIVGSNFALEQDFVYAGGDNYPDHIESVSAGFLVHSNDAPPFDCGVANPLGLGPPEVPRTIGTSFEFGQLVNGISPATRTELMANYIQFFNEGHPGGAPFNALIWIPEDVLEPDLARKAQQRELSLEQVQAIAHVTTSHDSLQAALESKGKTVEVTNILTTKNLADYDYVFVVLGIFPNNHVIRAGDPEATQLENHLAAGGELYMEGGDMWYFDPVILGAHDFGPSFAINATHDGFDDLKTILASCVVTGMDFIYKGQNNFIDHIAALEGACTLHYNDTPSYGVGVAHDNPITYKTIGNSFEFGGLEDNSIPGATTKVELMAQYLDFFDNGLDTPGGQVYAQVSSPPTFFTGCSITVPVIIDVSATEPAELLGAYNAKLNWDPTLLEYLGYVDGSPPFNDPIVSEDNTDSGELAFGQFSTTTGAGGEVNVINLEFNVVGDAGLSGVLNVSFSEMIAFGTYSNLLPITVTEDANFETELGCLLGDVTNDNKVNMFDAFVIANYAVGNTIPAEFLERIEQGCGDVTLDGLTRIFDAFVIANYAVGNDIPVEFPVGEPLCPEE